MTDLEFQYKKNTETLETLKEINENKGLVLTTLTQELI